jgi:acetate---CoA ligase (ADP-forming)
VTDRPGLARLVEPASVAIVGMSADPSKHGAKVLTSLRRFGFDGPVWGVNPKQPEIEGIEVVATLGDLPQPPDAVVLAVPADVTPDVIAAAGEIGAGAAILFGGGFAEAGADGDALQSRIVRLARERGVRLLGPNSAGVINPSAGTVLSFLTCLERPADQLRPGPVGLVTQSGGTGSFLHNLAAERGSGFALSISTGNEADIDAAEALRHLVEHPDVRSIALVLETVRDGPRFLTAARAALHAGKPIVVCKIGRSDVGQRVMRTHTGALAGSQRCYDAVFDALGITVAATPTELFEVTELMARTPVPAGDRVGFVTHSGGTAVLLADKATAAGLRLPQPSDRLRERLGPYLQHGATGNPTDLGGIITQPHRYLEVVRCFVDDPDYDLVVPVSTPHPTAHTPDRATALAALAREADKPLPNLWLAGDLGAEGLRLLRASDTPVTTDVDSLVTAIAGLVRLGTVRSAADDPAAEHSRAAPTDRHLVADLTERQRPDTAVDLDEAESKRLVARMGLETVRGRVVTSSADAERIAAELGYPVVLKAVSSDLPHKSDVGGVRLDLPDAEALATAWREIAADLRTRAPTAQVDGFLVERYVPGVEMIAGITHDPTFGPVVLVGTGGTVAEALGDVAVGLPPLSPTEAARLIDRLRGRALLAGFRGAAPADAAALADLVAQLSRLASTYGHLIAELDLNPIVFAEGRWQIADALLRLHPATNPEVVRRYLPAGGNSV